MHIFADIDECARNISGCNQDCTNTIGSYFCSCYPGYDIEHDNRTCVGKGLTQCFLCLIQTPYLIQHIFFIIFADIDECAHNISGCNQNCTNTIGSYFCSCYPGYDIQNDNRTCVGKDLTLSIYVCYYNSYISNLIYNIYLFFAMKLKTLTSVHLTTVDAIKIVQTLLKAISVPATLVMTLNMITEHVLVRD